MHDLFAEICNWVIINRLYMWFLNDTLFLINKSEVSKIKTYFTLIKYTNHIRMRILLGLMCKTAASLRTLFLEIRCVRSRIWERKIRKR